MKIRKLRRKHADFDLALLQKYRDLFEGGEAFGKNITRYLHRNQREPGVVYAQRCLQAADCYVNYSGPIGNYFKCWLFTSPLTYKIDGADAADDPFYASFKEDCDGKGTSIEKFMGERFIDSMIDRCAYWRVAFPEAPPDGSGPRSKKEWDEAGGGRAVFKHIPACNLINWKRDAAGFIWVIEYTKVCQLEEPDDEDETCTETWTIWRRTGQHERYQVVYPKSKPPSDAQDAPEVEMPADQGAIQGIPIVEMSFPKELWMMSLVAAPQLENFRKRAGLSWAIDRTNYAMPVFNMVNRNKPPVMGAGYFLMIGKDDKAGYLSPPPETFSVSKEYIAELKDEIHRVAQQMARGVDNNAAAVGRSGESKDADDLATEIVLAGMGTQLVGAVEKSFDLISEGRDDGVEHDVGGMATYHVTNADAFTKMVAAAQAVDIPSATHHREIAKRMSSLHLPDLDEEVRNTINEEIDRNISNESLTVQRENKLGGGGAGGSGEGEGGAGALPAPKLPPLT